MKKISEKEKKRQSIYAAQRVKDLCEEQSCKRCGTEFNLQRHHPNSRKDILDYFYLCSHCHMHIHAYPDKARREGYLK